MTSCERRYQNCGGRGSNPFHWHLLKKIVRRVDRLAAISSQNVLCVCDATDLPTPPKGRATIRLCRTLSLEQKLPLEVSLISLEMTCIARKVSSWSECKLAIQCRARKALFYLFAMYLTVGGVCIHTEGFLLLINEGNCLVHIIYSQNRENWAKNILLHDGVGFCHLCQNCWGFWRTKKIYFTTG